MSPDAAETLRSPRGRPSPVDLRFQASDLGLHRLSRVRIGVTERFGALERVPRNHESSQLLAAIRGLFSRLQDVLRQDEWNGSDDNDCIARPREDGFSPSRPGEGQDCQPLPV